MIELFMDTSKADVSIALLKDNKLLTLIKENVENKHSVYVLDCLEKVFQEYNLSVKEINKIYVVVGPGSFTGTRIGVTIAKTIAYLNKIKICPVSSLKMAVLNKCDSDYYLSIIDNKNDYYFYGLYDNNYKTIIEERNDINALKSIVNKYNPLIIADDINISDIHFEKTSFDINKIINYYRQQESYNHDDITINYLKNPAGVENK